jgi:hypothetical protein
MLTILALSFSSGVFPLPGEFVPPWVLSAIFSTTFSFIWDIKCDWGLLEFSEEAAKATREAKFLAATASSSSSSSKHHHHHHPHEKLPWWRPRWLPSTDSLLRRRRLLTWSGWYFFAIVTDGLMRIVWVSTISPAATTWLGIPTDYFKSIVYSIEVLRRNQWNYYRLENEHLANVEKQKVVNIVLLEASAFGEEAGKAAAAASATLPSEELDSVLASSTDSERPRARPAQSASSKKKTPFRLPKAIQVFGQQTVRRLAKLIAKVRGSGDSSGPQRSLQDASASANLADLEMVATAQ